MKKNLHFFLTPIVNENRFFKESEYILKNNIVDSVIVCGIWHEKLEEREIHLNGSQIIRYKSILKKLRINKLVEKTRLLKKLYDLLHLIMYSFFVIRLFIKEKPTFISVHNLILMPLAVLCSLFKDVKLVYVPHELETEKTGLSGFFKKISRVLERKLINNFSSVVLVCKPISEWYVKQYKLNSNNVFTIRNLPLKSSIENQIEAYNFKKKFKIKEPALLFIYQGLIEKNRGCDKLVDIFQNLNNKNLNLILMGYGQYYDFLKTKKINNVYLQDAVNQSDIIKYTAGADIGIFYVTTELSLSYKLCLPNKFFEYLHAEIPIIVSSNLVYLSELVNDYNLGWVVNPGHLQDFLADSESFSDFNNKKEALKVFKENLFWETDAIHYADIYKL